MRNAIQVSGVWLAKMILVLTGNLELAAAFGVLHLVRKLPLVLTKKEDGFRLEYPATPQDFQRMRDEILGDHP